MPLLSHERRKAMGGAALRGFFEGASKLASYHPAARPERYGIEVTRDTDYVGDGEERHRLDVYVPKAPPSAPAGSKRPVVFYVHGGAFRILSKDTHWSLALSYALEGYAVVNINYGLTPKHRFPEALYDVCKAYAWMVKNADSFDLDLSRVIVSGESAGANLSMALLVALLYERDEPFAKAVWDLGVVPKAVVPMCGILQVTEPERFARRKAHLPTLLRDRIEATMHEYLGPEETRIQGPFLDFADPLLVFERGIRPARPIPPMFLSVGTRDPLLDDTRRLARALTALGVDVDARYYRGGVHAFQAFVFQSLAKESWKHTHAFLRRVM